MQRDLLSLIEPANCRMQTVINGAHSELTKGHSTRAKVLLAPELSEDQPPLWDRGGKKQRGSPPHLYTPCFEHLYFHSRVCLKQFSKFQASTFKVSKIQTSTRNKHFSFFHVVPFGGGVRVLVVGDHSMRVLEDYDFEVDGDF